MLTPKTIHNAALEALDIICDERIEARTRALRAETSDEWDRARNLEENLQRLEEIMLTLRNSSSPTLGGSDPMTVSETDALTPHQEG